MTRRSEIVAEDRQVSKHARAIKFHALGIKPGEVVSDHGRGKSDAHRFAGAVRDEEPAIEQCAENAPRRSFGFLEDAGSLAALDLPPQEHIAQEAWDFFCRPLFGNPALGGKTNPLLHRIKVKQGAHELHLVDGRIEKKPAELCQPFIGKIPAPVEIAPPCGIGQRARAHVVIPPPGEPPRDHPEPMPVDLDPVEIGVRK